MYQQHYVDNMRFVTGLFITQYLSKTFLNYFWPFDSQMAGNLPWALANAIQISMHNDALLLPPALALLMHKPAQK